MRKLLSACVLVVPIVLSMANTAAAENQERYLLNCKLMDRTAELYQRYCTGETAQHGQLLCQGKLCILLIRNFQSQYSRPEREWPFGMPGSGHDSGIPRVETTAAAPVSANQTSRTTVQTSVDAVQTPAVVK
jgi:hypothetical protein